METKFYGYAIDRIIDDNLWDLFRHDFEGTTVDQFSSLSRQELVRLRTFLRCGGVYVAPNHRNRTISQSLIEILEEEERHEWTQDDIREASPDLSRGPITSAFITAERNLRPEILSRISSSTPSSPSRQRSIPLPPLPPSPMPQQSLPPPSPPQQMPMPPPPLLTDQNGPGNPPPTLPTNLSTNPRTTQDPLFTQPIAPPPAQDITLPSGARLISEIAKIYTNEQKYDGTNGSFDQKLTIFLDICQRVELPEKALMKAFPTMLKGLAQDHFYNNQLSQRTFIDACTNLRTFFEGPGYHRRNLDKWNATTLASIAEEDPKKSTYENVQLLINRLRQLQYGIMPDLRTVTFLHNKIVTACQGSPACRYAVSDPPSDLGGLINKLQSSITSYEKEKEQESISESYYTDRRFRKNKPQERNQPQTRQNNTCYICKRENCRSWKHTQKEQEESKARFRFRNSSRLNTNAPNFESRFNKAYQQYITEFEGDDEEEDNLGGTFEALLVDTTAPTTSTESTEQIPLTDSATEQFIAQTLVNRTYLHQLTLDQPSKTRAPEPKVIDCLATETSRYNTDQFYGIVIDTGASEVSTAGYGQFQALQRSDQTVKLNTATKGAVTIKFGIGISSCIGSSRINTPVGDVEFYIMMAPTPFLLSLADMDRLSVYYNNLNDTLVTSQGVIPVIRRFGHCFLLWNTSLCSYIIDSFDYQECYFTTMELQRLHRRFGHPSVARLQTVLERAGHNTSKETLEYITKYCTHCQRYGKSPGRFKFHLRDDTQFNHTIFVDILYIQSKPILHVVDEGTRYQTGRWLRNIGAKHTWDTLRECWIDTYLGPPEQITADIGSNFKSQEFKQYASVTGTNIKIVPVEAHHSIGIVERYHGPLRRIFRIIADEIPDLSKEMALQMAFKAINDTAGPDGLIPTLLVYGAYPRITEYDPPSPTTTQRAMAIRKAMAELQKIKAKQQVANALNQRNGPITTSVKDLPLNSDVLVWREGNTGQSGSWKGPYKLLRIEGESCVIALPREPKHFRITSVKPYYIDPELTDQEPQSTDHEDQTLSVNDRNDPQAPAIDDDTIVVDTTPQRRPRGRPRKNPALTVYLQEDDDTYTNSRQKETLGLLEKDVFEVIPQAPKGVRIFNSRFVDEIKNPGTEKAFAKSRLVVQAFNDQEKDLVLTQSPTIQRISQRLILCLATLQEQATGLYLRDISQAYVQSTTSLNRNFYIYPPRELADIIDLPKGAILKVVKPLYGVPEAGNHWFKTYHSHHINALGMTQSTYDPCLLYSNQPFGITGLQTDDTLFLGDLDFAKEEQIQLDKAGFLAKPREQLTSTCDLKFNGGIIHLQDDNHITITQERQGKNLRTVSKASISSTSSRGLIRTNLTTKEQYVAQRARGAYIASVSQPEAAYDLSVAAQAIDPTENDIKALNKRIQWQIENAARGLCFVTLKKDTLCLLMFSNALFANNKDLLSQIGYILVIADKKGNANILY